MEKSTVFLVRRCETLDLKHFETLDLAESVGCMSCLAGSLIQAAVV